MSSLLGVVADDFTGACDVGVQFKKRGLETLVLARAENLGDAGAAFDVVVIDTESRNIAPEDAYHKARRTLETFGKIGVKLVYKKIDSTLRGNIGAELDAVMEELNMKAVIVAPAFPAHGRTAVNGHLLVYGTPLERTDLAQDPLNPLKESHIPTLIGNQTKHRIGHIGLAGIRGGVYSLKKQVKRLIEEGNQIIVADAETQDDLAKIAMVSVDLDALPCGSAGLAEEFARLIAPRSSLLVVSGSVNTVTLGQIATAEKELGLKVLEPDLSGVLANEHRLKAAAKDLADKAQESLAEGRDFVIRLATSRDVISKIGELGEGLRMSNLEVADKLLSVLSGSFRKIVKKHKLRGLILIGGDSSVRIMAAMGAKGVRIEDEVLPGVPEGRVVGGKHDGMRVVTKAGGFGDSYTLLEIIESLGAEKYE